MVKNITSMYLADKAKCFSHIIVTPNRVLCPHQCWCWHQWYQGGTKANVPVLVSGVDNGTDHGTDHGTGAGINPPLDLSSLSLTFCLTGAMESSAVEVTLFLNGAPTSD